MHSRLLREYLHIDVQSVSKPPRGDNRNSARRIPQGLHELIKRSNRSREMIGRGWHERPMLTHRTRTFIAQQGRPQYTPCWIRRSPVPLADRGCRDQLSRCQPSRRALESGRLYNGTELLLLKGNRLNNRFKLRK